MSKKKNNEGVLQGILSYLAAITGNGWAISAAGAIQFLIEIKKKHSDWEPPIQPPATCSSFNPEQYVQYLLHQLDSELPPGINHEKLQELLGYYDLWKLYPSLHEQWIVTNNFGQPIAPFIKVWENVKCNSNALPIKFIRSRENKYQLPVVANYLSAKITRLTERKLRSNEHKLRICSFQEINGNLVLEYSVNRYTDYLKTNWIVANIDRESSLELRKEICGVGNLLDLKNSLCANDLGVSAIISFKDELLLPYSSSEVISSPEMLVPTASGGADFEPYYYFKQDPGPAQDIIREAIEELPLDTSSFEDGTVRFLSLTRNVLRGGKPEAFYYINFPFALDVKETRFEHKDHSIIRLPSLLDVNDVPASDFETKINQILPYIYDKSRENLIISPFTRIALYYYVEYARNCKNSII
ncbi:MAG: hypothetical protein KKI15_07665 [Proteobacteria bacterium]|nr:hypothetical protein [Pseudomonadota bacterium]